MVLLVVGCGVFLVMVVDVMEKEVMVVIVLGRGGNGSVGGHEKMIAVAFTPLECRSHW